MKYLCLLALAGWFHAQAPAATPVDPSLVKDPAERARIDLALPQQPPAPPLKPRKLLIFELNVNYGGHPSIRHASYALARMGEKTGAFETVISRDPAVFERESLKQFDAVFFNNNVGNLFTDPRLRDNLAEFVYSGGGIMGVHGTTVAFTQWPGAVEDWPEFGAIIGARGASHKDSTELVTIKLDDPGHPINRVFAGQGFDYRDEFFRVHEPYSRHKLRILFSIDTVRTDVKAGQPRGDCLRADDDYALAWVRGYGRGRSFYCTIAHNPYVFWDARMLQFYFAAAQFALGDLRAPTAPSNQLTPAVRALEKLGWGLGWQPAAEAGASLYDTVDRAAKAGVATLSAVLGQRVSPTLAVPFGPGLNDDQRKQIRLTLEAAGVRLQTLHVQALPPDESGWRALFDFARRLGVATVVAAPPAGQLRLLDKLCCEFELNLALAAAAGSPYAQLETAVKACADGSRRLGVAAEVRSWLSSGVDPVAAAGQLKDRLLVLRLDDLDRSTASAKAVSWGSGAANLAAVLSTIHRSGAQPLLLAGAPEDAAFSAHTPNAQFLNRLVIELAK